MPFTNTYHIPDYYPSFHCKMGACRHPCCSIGWNITVTLQEYFKLVGLPCSPELRARLDSAPIVPHDADENRYALLAPRYDGNCPLHLPNGLCALQAECGEETLTAACRYYPRSPASLFGTYRSCACANSCEAVLELICHDISAAPLQFTEEALTFDLPKQSSPLEDAASLAYPEAERRLIALLQNRASPLPDRLAALADLAAAESGSASLPQSAQKDVPEEALLPVLTALCRFFMWITENNRDLSDLAQNALDRLSFDSNAAHPDTLAAWRRAEQDLAKAFPSWDEMVENQLVNHLFYSHFAFVSPEGTLADCALAFLTAHALVHGMVALNFGHLPSDSLLAGEEGFSLYIDLTAACYRFIEHTAFDKNAVVLMRRFGVTSPASTRLLAYL